MLVALVAGLLASCALLGDPDEPPAAAPDTPTPPTPTPAQPPPVDTPTPEDTPTPAPTPEPTGVGAYAVSAGHPAAVEAAMEILATGGNAVDAAITAAFAVSVAEPFASGLGGGGAAVVAEPGEEPRAYDYREVVAQDGVIPASNTGVPGFVAGMEHLQAAHGSVAMSELVAPAVSLARDGVEVSGMLAAQLSTAANRLPVGDLDHLYPAGAPLRNGDRLVQEELAGTLERVGERGHAALIEALPDHAADVDAASLEAYRVQERVPASGSFAGFEVHAAGPPLPGPSLIQTLQVAEALGLEEHEPGSADFVHVLAVSWQVAAHVLGDVLGDPDFVDVPVAELTDPERNRAIADQLALDAVPDPARVDPDADANTTHVTVVDANGMVVSMTNTLTNFWGSGEYALGFFLNDQLARFSIGRTAANEPAPGKRSISWSLPAIVVDDEARPVLGLGSPGGARIPMLLAQLLGRWAMHSEDLQAAVDAPRFHINAGVLEFEQRPSEDDVSALLGRGHAGVEEPTPPYYFGSVQALEVDYDAGVIHGATDARREGTWAHAQAP